MKFKKGEFNSLIKTEVVLKLKDQRKKHAFEKSLIKTEVVLKSATSGRYVPSRCLIKTEVVLK